MSETKNIICLGKTFATDEERREYYRTLLRAKLPELKLIEGYPIGEDDDIIALSDPPYYTACPNPWLNDFITEWEHEKQNIPNRKNDFFVAEPYASDVSEGKNNPIYNAHSYHTKVPHPAIMRYILHYTQPGDIVFDGFAGTGMTGVAAIKCSQPSNEEKFKIESDWKNLFNTVPFWGNRRAILNDLSPVASSISYSYNCEFDIDKFIERAEMIIQIVKKEIGWIYEIEHQNGIKGIINYTIWSDVFICPSCSNELIYWNETVDIQNDKQESEFKCSFCNKELSKVDLSKKFITKYDPIAKATIKQIKTVPVLINYSVGNKRFQRIPNENDISIIDKIDTINLNSFGNIPKQVIPKGDKTGEPLRIGYDKAYHLYTLRNTYALSNIFSEIIFDNRIGLLFTSIILNSSRLYRWRINGKGGYLNGTLYVASLTQENNVIKIFEDKINDLKFNIDNFNLVQTGSADNIPLSSNTVDYIFTDPPFGANIMYSELNFLIESWLKITTNNKREAIENKTQNKNAIDYQKIMADCFKEYFRILKPNKWMTVEFSNTNAAVWNGIQTALQKAGFIIANVAAIDKQQGSFNAVTNTTSVKQDLIISCYKPSADFEQKMRTAHDGVAVWDFVVEHLHHLPVHIKKDNSTTAIVERSPKILYDRLITYYLMRSLQIPIDAKDFQEGLKERFAERDGMYFTAEQVAEYDEKKAKAPTMMQLSLIITTESDAIEWLKERVRKTPQKYQDIMPDFRIATQSLRKGDTLPELKDILEQGFIQETDGKWRVPDMNEGKDREALRTKVLLKEYNTYLTELGKPKAKKLKEVRVEALRAGFKANWERQDFKTIVDIGDMIPQNILLEDEQLLMFYDIAKDRI